jgi:hypothetical protein
LHLFVTVPTNTQTSVRTRHCEGIAHILRDTWELGGTDQQREPVFKLLLFRQLDEFRVNAHMKRSCSWVIER